MKESRYGMGVDVALPYEQAVERATEELKKEGFGILTTIDVRQTLKQKLDKDFRKYTILGACNPPLAHQALTAEPEIGLLLPCNVVVAATDGGSEVQIADPKAMFSIIGNPDVGPLADEVGAKLRRVLERI